MGYGFVNLPPQQLAFNKKTKEWRKKHLQWANSKSLFNFSLVRNSVIHKKINYDLVDGKIHMNDLEMILNPDNLDAGFIPEKIQHYPIINAKLNVLKGEEYKRVFDYKVVVTNPNSISEIENNKKNELFQKLQEWVLNSAQSEEEAVKELEKLQDYYTYEWQDTREIRANSLLNHYTKEYNVPLLFNKGFMDALTTGEEIYICDIVGGEPTIERVNPLKLRAFKSGYDSEIEKADIIIIEDYWSPSKIIDTYYDVLSEKDMKYIEKMPNTIGQSSTNPMDEIDDRTGFIHSSMLGDEFSNGQFYFDPMNEYNDKINSLLPYDLAGNIRVLRMYWKSRRRVKKVTSYDPQTGEEIFNFYPENYVTREDLGEEEQILWINEAWEGTLIGNEVYVNMRPRPVQYNRLSNPSRCHFGIVGSVYNMNDSKPFSLVDMMKPYNYAYDVIHDRLNKLLARNWGTLVELDFAKVPKGWDTDKWMYYARTMGIAVKDSFNEGSYGASMGKLAGALNNASTGVIATADGNQIQQYINLLDFIKMEMADVAGISKQREGQISNRETVGGVERATLQSSHITEWIFSIHEDVKKRVLECFLETAKIALKGRKKKFQYLLSDGSTRVADIDGDEFAESDYGLVVDNSNGIQELNQKLDMLAQAALQNQAIDFSTVMKLYTSTSMAEKQRMIEVNEQKIKQMQQEQQQQQMQLQQQQMEQQAQIAQAQMEQQYRMHSEDNETKIIVAEINSQAEAQRFAMMNDDEEVYTEKDKAELKEKMRQFDIKIKLDRERLAFDKSKAETDAKLKKMQINKKSSSSK